MNSRFIIINESSRKPIQRSIQIGKYRLCITNAKYQVLVTNNTTIIIVKALRLNTVHVTDLGLPLHLRVVKNKKLWKTKWMPGRMRPIIGNLIAARQRSQI